jgi:WD40 repeat protein
VVKTANWNTKANLRSHLDSVRTLNWHHNYLISAGEDATLKIW